MRELISVEAILPFTLKCKFNNNETKVVDLNPMVEKPVFKFLLNGNNFKNFINKKYFIEWPMFEADLSADTLWHLGK